MNHYKHWDIQTDTQDIIWLGFDRQGQRVNTINQDVLDEFHILQSLRKRLIF